MRSRASSHTRSACNRSNGSHCPIARGHGPEFPKLVPAAFGQRSNNSFQLSISQNYIPQNSICFDIRSAIQLAIARCHSKANPATCGIGPNFRYFRLPYHAISTLTSSHLSHHPEIHTVPPQRCGQCCTDQQSDHYRDSWCSLPAKFGKPLTRLTLEPQITKHIWIYPD